MLASLPPLSLRPDRIGELECTLVGRKWFMRLGGRQIMTHDTTTLRQARELVNHVRFAEGEVICTGLGLGLREAWLLTKPEVTKLTILENSPDVISYHLTHSDWIYDTRVNLVQADCLDYKGSCDSLLLDHFPDQADYFGSEFWLKEAEEVQRNIKSAMTWVWPIEMVLGATGPDRYSEIRRKYAINLPSFTRTTLRETVRAATGAEYVCAN